MAESGTSSPQALAHRVTRMVGRDPNEPHRASTPLELLFDLTFVVGSGSPPTSWRTCWPRGIWRAR